MLDFIYIDILCEARGAPAPHQPITSRVSDTPRRRRPGARTTEMRKRRSARGSRHVARPVETRRVTRTTRRVRLRWLHSRLSAAHQHPQLRPASTHRAATQQTATDASHACTRHALTALPGSRFCHNCRSSITTRSAPSPVAHATHHTTGRYDASTGNLSSCSLSLSACMEVWNAIPHTVWRRARPLVSAPAQLTQHSGAAEAAPAEARGWASFPAHIPK